MGAWAKTLSFVVVFVVIALVLIVVPADFDIHGRGKLQPTVQREIFAPVDGQLVDLRAEHNEDVEQGEVVLVLDSPQLDIEFERIEAEYESTRKRMTAIQAERVQTQLGDAAAETRLQRLTAEMEELNQLQRSQQRQLQMIAKEKASLQITSPLAGRIITWDVDRRLRDRPVRRGQALLTVANVDGPWEAEVWIPANKIRWLQKSEQPSGPAATVHLTADQQSVSEGVLTKQPVRAELNEDGQPGAWVRISVDRKAFTDLRPGASVTAEIHCGRASLGYVWFADMFDSIRGWLAFL